MLLTEGQGKLKKLNFIGVIWSLALGFVAMSSSAFGGSGGLAIGKDTTICLGKCVTLTSGISGACTWSTGETTSSIKVCPSTDQTVTLQVNTGQVTLYDTIHITVDKYCVYPGDADENGTVDKNDVLKIALAYGNTGSQRAVSGYTWDAVHADDWSKKFKSGLNYKYADCNGDGKIDSNDVKIISTNYSHTHNKTEATTDDGIADLYYIANKDSVQPGDTLVLKIMLGTETNPVYNVYGVSFTHVFSGLVAQDKSMMLDVNPMNCWFFDANPSVMWFLHPDYGLPSGDIVISRTDGQVVSGYGQIGTLSVVVADNVAGKRSFDGPISLTPTDAKAISNDETNIPLTEKASIVYWKTVVSGIKPTILDFNSRVQVYPNPVTGRTLTINFSDLKSESIAITDLLGNEVFTSTKPGNGQTQELELPNLKQGVYLLKVATSQGLVTKKLYITN
jgi:hypothetical protein